MLPTFYHCSVSAECEVAASFFVFFLQSCKLMCSYFVDVIILGIQGVKRFYFSCFVVTVMAIQELFISPPEH